MDAADILAALSLAKQGRIYDLAVDLASQVRQLPAEHASPFTYTREFFGDPTKAGLQFCSETVTAPIHHGTHIDAFIHCQMQGCTYGGHLADDIQNEHGWLEHGAETIAPIICRGVVVDLAAFLGHVVPNGYSISREEIASAVEKQGVTLKAGDAVLVRTGKILEYHDDPLTAWWACPGMSVEAASWLADQGMGVFGIDAASLDPLPITDWHRTAHEELLIKRGIHVVENLYLEELVQDGVREFTFICLPLKIAGATGSWTRPIAIV